MASIVTENPENQDSESKNKLLVLNQHLRILWNIFSHSQVTAPQTWTTPYNLNSWGITHSLLELLASCDTQIRRGGKEIIFTVEFLAHASFVDIHYLL